MSFLNEPWQSMANIASIVALVITISGILFGIFRHIRRRSLQNRKGGPQPNLGSQVNAEKLNAGHDININIVNATPSRTTEAGVAQPPDRQSSLISDSTRLHKSQMPNLDLFAEMSDNELEAKFQEKAMKCFRLHEHEIRDMLNSQFSSELRSYP